MPNIAKKTHRDTKDKLTTMNGILRAKKSLSKPLFTTYLFGAGFDGAAEDEGEAGAAEDAIV